MFADFLTPHQSDFYADGMPGGNFFKDFTISKGEKAVELNLSMDTLRGYLRDYEGHWDGYARVLIQARTAYDAAMPAGSKSVTVKFAASRDADAIVSAITGGTQIGRKSPSGTNVLPYQLDWQQHDSASEKGHDQWHGLFQDQYRRSGREGAMITARPAYPTRPTAG